MHYSKNTEKKREQKSKTERITADYQHTGVGNISTGYEKPRKTEEKRTDNVKRSAPEKK